MFLIVLDHQCEQPLAINNCLEGCVQYSSFAYHCTRCVEGFTHSDRCLGEFNDCYDLKVPNRNNLWYSHVIVKHVLVELIIVEIKNFLVTAPLQINQIQTCFLRNCSHFESKIISKTLAVRLKNQALLLLVIVAVTQKNQALFL